MSLQNWANNGWLRPHQTSPQEMKDLLAIVDRDLADAKGDISADWKFGIAYNAALKLCTMLIYASGYRPERTLQHYRSIQALSLILGDERASDVEYLDTCRIKRHIAEYNQAGSITQSNADELIEFTRSLRGDVLEWLRLHKPELVPSGAP